MDREMFNGFFDEAMRLHTAVMTAMMENDKETRKLAMSDVVGFLNDDSAGYAEFRVNAYIQASAYTSAQALRIASALTGDLERPVTPEQILQIMATERHTDRAD